MTHTTVRPTTSNETVAYYKAKIEELTMEYQGKGNDLDESYFIRLNAYRDAAKYAANMKGDK